MNICAPPPRHGYGEGGLRAPHQDYRWYKFYGFAGRGAATAWGCNPGKVPTGGLGHASMRALESPAPG